VVRLHMLPKAFEKLKDVVPARKKVAGIMGVVPEPVNISIYVDTWLPCEWILFNDGGEPIARSST